MAWRRVASSLLVALSAATPAFAPQDTDAAVAQIALDLNRCGAPPLRAEVVQSKAADNQTFDTIKFAFPRGDATSLMFGFDAQGKITGLAIGAMSGD